MTLAEARAILVAPGGRSRAIESPHEAWRDAEALHRIAMACQWATPMVCEDPPRGLVLDLRGCDRVLAGYGGIALVVDRLEADLSRWGIHGRIAGAETATMARAWARYGPESIGSTAFRQHRVVESRRHRHHLEALPVASLELEPEVERAMSAVRIRTIGDLRAIPRATIPVRYGRATLHRLDEADGRRTEVLTPVVGEEPMVVRARFAGPVHDALAIEYRMAELVRDLAVQLGHRGLRAMDLEVQVRRPGRGDWSELVRCAAGTRRATHLWSVLRPVTDRIPLDDGVDEIRIRLVRGRSAADRVGLFWNDSEASSEDHRCDDLVDRVVARFGSESVRRFSPRRNHVPEEQFRLVEDAASSADDVVPADSLATLSRFLGRFGSDPRRRPTVMLDAVEPIEVVEFAHGPASVVWRGRCYDAYEVYGPELIGVPWWRECAGRSGTDARREYWRVVPVNGPWLWMFRRSSDRRWFMHGLWA